MERGKELGLPMGESKAGWLGTTLKIHFIAFLYIPCRKTGKYKNVNGVK